MELMILPMSGERRRKYMFGVSFYGRLRYLDKKYLYCVARTVTFSWEIGIHIKSDFL